ncbi:MAG TPA: LysR substrate-binding domain-containing protein [Nocardioidaceae bacterium]
MELRQLRYFVAVAEELHFARAASRLLITSPTLSQQVKSLERDLGVRLFDRSSAGVRLTAAGQELVRLARGTLSAAEDLEETARRLAQGRASTLRLGFVSFSLTAPARRLLSEFARAEPTVDLQLRQFEWDDPSAGLVDGSTDAALVRRPFSGMERLRWVEVGRDELVVVMAEDHPLASRPVLSARRLAGVPFLETRIVQDPAFAAYWYLRRLKGSRAPAVSSRAVTVEEWLGEIALGRGVNLVPAGMVEEYRKPGLAFVPVADLEPSSVVLAWHPARESDAVRRFVALAEQATAPA